MSKVFFNKRVGFFEAAYIVLIGFGIWSLKEDFGISVAVIAVGVLLLLGYILVFPNFYRLDENGITVYYGFGIKVTARWEELAAIEDHRSRRFPWLREYQMRYFKAKCPFHTEVSIPKNRKTAVLIQKYYKKAIVKVG